MIFSVAAKTESEEASLVPLSVDSFGNFLFLLSRFNFFLDLFHLDFVLESFFFLQAVDVSLQDAFDSCGDLVDTI